MGRDTPPRLSATPRAVEIDTAALRGDLRKMRAARGLSQANTAALIGVSQATVSSFESGTYAGVRAETLLAIRSLVEHWKRDRAGARQKSPRRVVLLAPADEAAGVCTWCGFALPRLERPARFCPMCGGRQPHARSRSGANGEPPRVDRDESPQG